jgi:hypothetical protein
MRIGAVRAVDPWLLAYGVATRAGKTQNVVRRLSVEHPGDPGSQAGSVFLLSNPVNQKSKEKLRFS